MARAMEETDPQNWDFFRSWEPEKPPQPRAAEEMQQLKIAYWDRNLGRKGIIGENGKSKESTD